MEQNIVSITQAKERRKDKRFKHSTYCEITKEKIFNQAVYLVKTENISKNGAKIRYVGEPLPAGGLVNIDILNLNLQRAAYVMWSNPINETKALAGLKFTKPISIPQFHISEAS